MNENEYYCSSDLPLVCALSLFYSIESVDKQSIPTRTQFYFKRCTDLDKLIETYWRKELKVEPQAYYYQLKYLKSWARAEK